MPNAKTKPRSNKASSRIATRALAVAALICVLAIVFWPRLTATFSDSLNPYDPFSSSVTITNTGFIPLYDVELAIVPVHIWNGNTTFKSDPNHPALFWFNKWGKHDVGINCKFTVLLDDAFQAASGSQIIDAEIEIVAKYTVPIIHWQRTRTFTVVSRRQNNGSFTWDSKKTPN